MKWGCALLLAGSILFLGLACRGPAQLIAIVPGGILAVLLVLGFLLLTGWIFGQPRRLG
jgi:hypothetical protein